MHLYSTNDTHRTQPFTFQEAVFKSLPDDNGLFMPALVAPPARVVFRHD